MPDGKMSLDVKKLSPNATLPTLATPGSAGYDLYSAYDVLIAPWSHQLVPTDIAVAIPEGLYGRIASRSGLALKFGLEVGAGICDNDYRGPVGVVLHNFSDNPYQIKKGDRIAQFILHHNSTPPVVEVSTLDETERNVNGFGSTGR